MANRLTTLIQKSDSLLSNIAQGYGNDSYVGMELFPEITVPKERVRVPEYGKENLKLYDSERALRAASNVLTPDDINLTEIALKEYDLAFPIDYRETAITKEIFDLQRYAAQNVTDALRLKQESLIATLAQNAANYASDNKEALTGGDKWSASTGTPVADIAAARAAVRSSCGKYPNVLLLGAKTYEALKENKDIVDRIKYAQTGIVTESLLAAILNVDKVVIGRSISVDSTGAFVDVWSDTAILAHVPQGARAQRSPFVPSYGYTFTMENFPMIDTWEADDKKVSYVRGTLMTAPTLLAPSCGFLFTGCAI